MSSGSLSDLLFERARQHPERDYVLHKARSLSYGDFAALVARLAAQLEVERLGGAARIVGVSTDDPLQLLCAVWACALSDCSLAFCPLIDDVESVKSSLDQVGAATLLTNRTALLSNSWAISLDKMLVDSDAAAPRSSKCDETARANAAFLFQTSGTSGEPKWVRCEQWKCFEVVECMWREGVLTHAVDQTVFLTAPLFHSYGLSSCFEYTRAGATIVLPAGDSPLGPVGELRQAKLASRVNAIEGVPNFHLQLSQLISRLSLPQLKHIGFGGGALDRVAVDRIRMRHPALTYSVRYGLTETPSVVTHKVFRPPYEVDWTLSGRIVSIYQLEILDADGAAVPAGHEGQIVVNGDCVCSYVGSRATTVLNTGDVGYLTESGELKVVGRGSAFLKYRGYRLSPEQIESAIRTFGEVQDCRALVRDERLVAEIVASVTTFSRSSLLAHIKTKLPLHAIPEDITLVDAVPRTASGKLKRH
jgi:acyl-CoA synthetase (AMP-forming)/AMP-acid ligase II